MSATPPLGGEVPWGKSCTWGPDGSLCGKPAILHIQWDAEGENSMACPQHALVAFGWAVFDSHSLGPVCGMPGSWWDYDNDRCFIPDLDDSVPELAALAGEDA